MDARIGRTIIGFILVAVLLGFLRFTKIRLIQRQNLLNLRVYVRVQSSTWTLNISIIWVI